MVGEKKKPDRTVRLSGAGLPAQDGGNKKEEQTMITKPSTKSRYVFTRYCPNVQMPDSRIRFGDTVWGAWEQLHWTYDPATIYTVSTGAWHGYFDLDAQDKLVVHQAAN
jgi:hypothetical protein